MWRHRRQNSTSSCAYKAKSAAIRVADGLPDDVIAIAAGYDITLRYGAQTPFSDSMADHLEGGQWRVDDTHTSIIAAGNGLASSVKATLTIYYNQGTAQYRMEKEIAADDQLWVDVGKLIRNQTPDMDGNILPSTATSGAYSLKVTGQPLQPALFEAKVITDKTFGHATYGCMICCGYGGPYFNPDPGLAAVGASSGVDVYGTDACTAFPTEVDGYFGTWSSANTGIFTMSPALIHGVSAGSAAIEADASELPDGTGQDSGHGRSCPQRPGTARGTGNVKAPNHLSVVSDNMTPYSCPIGSSRRRVVNYNVIATDNTVWSLPMSALETVDPSTISSCTSTTVATSYTCTPLPSGTGNFSDGLNPGCPSTAALANGCGFVFSDQVWEWCQPLGVPLPLANIGTDNVQNTSISLGGNTAGFPAGTTFPK